MDILDMRVREGFSREVIFNRDVSAENGPWRGGSGEGAFQAEGEAGANAQRREAVGTFQEQGGELGSWTSVKESGR